MSLRARLALAILLAAVPLVAGAVWLRRVIEVRGVEDAMREFALAMMEAGGREVCERDPEHFGFEGPPPGGPRRPPSAGPGPTVPGGPDPRRVPDPPGPRRPGDGPRDASAGAPPTGFPFGPSRGPTVRGTRLWAYRADLGSANPRAPGLAPALADPVRDGAESASVPWHEGEREGRRLLLRTPWPDGPCAVLLVERLLPETPGAVRAFLYAAAALVGGLLLAVLLSAGPLVRRIRRLTADVTRSAASRYAEPVPTSSRDEIGRLAQAFNGAGAEVRGHIESLEARERTLREFVSNTAHDVAIPLTVLQGHLTTLREATPAAAPSDAVRGAMEEAQYIACLLQNLTSVARLEASPESLERRPVDLRALLERVVARHLPIARGASIALEHAVPAEPVVARGDVTLLEQAVSNLVHNAIRYHRAGGHVAAVLSRTSGPAPRFTLRVVDDGPGIPDDELPHVLERSFRGREARTRAPHGAGLGLHIAHDVVGRHGFDLALARPDGGGLEATISGACAEEPPAAPRGPAEAGALPPGTART